VVVSAGRGIASARRCGVPEGRRGFRCRPCGWDRMATERSEACLTGRVVPGSSPQAPHRCADLRASHWRRHRKPAVTGAPQSYGRKDHRDQGPAVACGGDRRSRLRLTRGAWVG
jgi:hypothetical protein